MIWLRKGVVHLLAFVLFLVLVVSALAAGANSTLGTPDKLKAWLTASNIYIKTVPAVLEKSQNASLQDGNEASIPLNNNSVEKAAEQAFSPVLIEQSANTIIDGNYAWLQGKTSTPKFTVDLTQAKEDFAQNVHLLVQTRMASLPACSVAQLAQLQIPVNPLVIDCRPSTLDPKIEGARIALEIRDSDFLSKPVLTADSLNQAKSAQSQPYYAKLSRAPKLYQLGQKLPLFGAGIALFCALVIIAIAPTRRRGLRRIGFMFLDAGIVLLALKFASDGVINRFQARVLKQTFSGELAQPYSSVLRSIESSLTHAYLTFGTAFIVLAVAIFVPLLVVHRRGQPKKDKSHNKPAAPLDEAAEPAPAPHTEIPRSAPRSTPAHLEVSGPPALPQPPRHQPQHQQPDDKPPISAGRSLPPIKRRTQPHTPPRRPPSGLIQ